jgi:hypothetical protein
MKAVVFLGPTMPVAAARDHLDATYLPPARQGDLISAAYSYRPAAIGLVDGYFFHSLSVWHKEIIGALDMGIRVYGASSIGALRAAETSRHGMRGVGRVFELYRDGVLQDDDEVALVHAGPEDGYRALSLPMVNVRATLDMACDEGHLDEIWLQKATAAAKAIYFPERGARAIVDAVGSLGAPATVLDALAFALRERYVDVKRDDAAELLTLMRTEVAEGTSAMARKSLVRDAERAEAYYFLRALKDRDRTVLSRGRAVALAHIAEVAALHRPELATASANALNRQLVCVLAALLGAEPSAEDLARAEAALRQRLSIETDAAMARWLADNDLEIEELRELVRELAVSGKLQRWYLAGRLMDGNTRNILNELRMSGEYGQWRERAAEEVRSVSDDAVERAWNANDLSLAELMAAHCSEAGVVVDWVDRVAEVGFQSPQDAQIALLRSRLARLAEDSMEGEA